MDYELWETYVPVSDDLTPPVNKNIKLVNADCCELINIDEEDLDYILDDNEMRFAYSSIEGDAKIWYNNSSEFYVIEKDEINYLVYNYQNTGYYVEDNKVTFTGWDDNVIVDLTDMKFKIKHVR